MVLCSADLDDEVREILIADIMVSPQVRTEFESTPLTELAESLKEAGQQQPILVRSRGDKYALIFGERRLRAAQLAGWSKIRAIITHVDLTESEIVQRQLIENVQRVDLCPLEVAKGIRQLMELDGVKLAAVAKKLGISAAKATKLLSLLSLPESIQEKVARGEIVSSAGYELSRVDDDQMRTQLAEDLVAGRINRDGLVKEIKARTTTRKSAPSAVKSRATASLVGGATLTVVASSLNLEMFIEILEEVLEVARKEHKAGTQLGTFLQRLRDHAMRSDLAELTKT